MIYITGDLHGLRDAIKLNEKYFQEVVNKPENTLIVVGDAGFSWPGMTDKMLKFFDEIGLKCKIVSVLGNNDNYDDIYSRPQYDYCGGKVVCADGKMPEDSKVMYLMNGYVYNFEGKTFAVLGGADSYDAPFRCEKQKDRVFAHPRTEHECWWKEELPAVEDYQRLKKLLLKNPKVDFLLSHEGTTKVVGQNFKWSIEDNKFANNMNGHRNSETRTVRDMNDVLQDIVDCKCWIFGHHHHLIYSTAEKNPMLCIFNEFVDVNNLEHIEVYNTNGKNITDRLIPTENCDF